MKEVIQHIIHCRQVYRISDYDESATFCHTDVFFRQDNQLYFTKINDYLDEPTETNRREFPIFDIESPNVYLMPPTANQAKRFDGITKYESSAALSSDIFIKTPNISFYDPDTGFCDSVKRVQPEVTILELIKADKDRRGDDNVGQNIVEYYGCCHSSDGLWVTGICLKKYICTLYDIKCAKMRLGDDSEADPKDLELSEIHLDPERIIKGVINGIQYLHSLDIIHSDLNPSNIMIDADGRPIIIDFNVSVFRGEPRVGGTVGWVDNDHLAIADNNVDIRSLYRLVVFMHKHFGLDNLELPSEYEGDADDFALVRQWLGARFDSVKQWF